MADTSLSSHVQCETIVEDLDDDIISLFSQSTKHVAEELCNGVSGTIQKDILRFLYCTYCIQKCCLAVQFIKSFIIISVFNFRLL